MSHYSVFPGTFGYKCAFTRSRHAYYENEDGIARSLFNSSENGEVFGLLVNMLGERDRVCFFYSYVASINTRKAQAE